jgi:uncharacterized membrane protein
MKFFWKTFLKGLVAMIPLAVTVWLVGWLALGAEAALGGPIKALLPDGWYVPGLGVAAALVFIFVVGLLLNMVIARMLFHRFEAMLNRLPLIKSLYGSVKDLMGFFMDTEKKGQQAVIVTLWTPPPPEMSVTLATDGESPATQGTPTAISPPQAPTPMRVLGLVTREDFSHLPDGIGDDQSVAVYVPMSYQLGGFTLIVKKSQLQPISMSTEDALRFAITAGMKAKTPLDRPVKVPGVRGG